MSYSTDADLDLLFGKANVDAWADVDNDQDDDKIAARRAWAREEAYDELNSKLARSPYQFPLAGPTYPRIVVRIEATLACMLLNESRSITDVEEEPGDLKAIAKRVEKFINGIKLGTVQLPGVSPAVPATEVPFAVNDFPQVSFDDDDTWFDPFNVIP